MSFWLVRIAISEHWPAFVDLFKMLGRDIKTAVFMLKMRAIYALYTHHIRTIHAPDTHQTCSGHAPDTPKRGIRSDYAKHNPVTPSKGKFPKDTHAFPFFVPWTEVQNHGLGWMPKTAPKNAPKLSFFDNERKLFEKKCKKMPILGPKCQKAVKKRHLDLEEICIHFTNRKPLKYNMKRTSEMPHTPTRSK